MKIGILVEDRGITGIDFTNIYEGNPGVGGTVFEEIMLAESLIRTTDISVCLYCTSNENKYNKLLEVRTLQEIYEAPKRAELDGVDILIFCAGKEMEWYEALGKSKISTIAWCHGFLNHYELKKIRELSVIKRVVFVGKNHYSTYIADDIILKSTYIYNMFDGNKSLRRDKFSHDVCYLGALNRYKGFHVLAQAWPLVLEKVPDAQLYVLGSGTLYNNSAKLGAYGIAEDKYEKRFVKYIKDNEGSIIPSVHFLGNVKSNKDSIISHMSVGVVNPTGVTETFCISAIEINACGVPVCTKGIYGLRDTVIDGKTGLYSDNYVQLANNIVTLIEDIDLNKRMSENAVLHIQQYTPYKILPGWIKLFNDVCEEIMPAVNESVLNDVRTTEDKIKKVFYNLRFKKKIKMIPSPNYFDYFFKGMQRVFIRDTIYHFFKRGEDNDFGCNDYIQW